ncbi:hypothetical protein APASM_0578 [Actinosynnema pretiosum subsp. pretiosum]|nr:hypothetical protein APASM_0578 [Actinosynnema pretiosum subsp. pretiosum]
MAGRPLHSARPPGEGLGALHALPSGSPIGVGPLQSLRRTGGARLGPRGPVGGRSGRGALQRLGPGGLVRPGRGALRARPVGVVRTEPRGRPVLLPVAGGVLPRGVRLVDIPLPATGVKTGLAAAARPETLVVGLLRLVLRLVLGHVHNSGVCA